MIYDKLVKDAGKRTRMKTNKKKNEFGLGKAFIDWSMLFDLSGKVFGKNTRQLSNLD